MFLAALYFAGIYTVFAPAFAGERRAKKHLFIGLALIVVFGVLAYATGEMK